MTRTMTGAIALLLLTPVVSGQGTVQGSTIQPYARVDVLFPPDPMDEDTDNGGCLPNGQTAVLETLATNILGPGLDTNGVADIYLVDALGPYPIRISTGWAGVEADQGSFSPGVSANGNLVVFASDATNLLAAPDLLAFRDIFLHDVSAGLTQKVSIPYQVLGGEPTGNSNTPAISGNGNWVTFSSAADDLVAGDTGFRDIFLWERATGTTTRISNGLGGSPDGDSRRPVISRDGTLVAFESDATNLVPGDGNGRRDVFLYNVATGMMRRISVDAGGGDGNGNSLRPAIDSTGRFVAFESTATDLVASDNNGLLDVFLRDRSLSKTFRISVPSGGVESNGPSRGASVSMNGRVTFWSDATNLVAADTNGVRDVFLHDPLLGLVRASVASDGTESDGASNRPVLGDLGVDMVFVSDSTNLAPDDTAGVRDFFFHRDRAMGLTLDVDPPISSLGAPLTFTVGGGEPGRIVFLYATHVSGVPFNFKLLKGNFNGAGDYQISLPVPQDPTLSGLVVTFLAFGVRSPGTVGLSNPRWTYIQ